MNKIKLGVIFGGKSTEHYVSCVSGTSVLKNLNKDKYDIVPIYIDLEGNWFTYEKNINQIDVLEIGNEPKEIKPILNVIEEIKKLDVIFPVLHGLYGEDGTIQGFFELLNIPYVGCKVLASSVCMNKIYSKIIFERAGLNQAKYIVINKDNNNNNIYVDSKMNHYKKTNEEICNIVKNELKYPVFVKPSNSGSSVGVNKATNDKELINAIDEAGKFDKEILVEQAIDGKEIECGVLEYKDTKTSCVGQILSAENFYNYNSKYKNIESKTVIPANIEENISNEIKRLAIKAFKAANCTGLSRVDFFVDRKTSKIYINEINTLPGFTNISMYPKLWEHEGIKYSELLDKLIEQAISNKK